VRDPSGATNVPGDPGPIIAVLANYLNSARTTVRGLDLDVRQAFELGPEHGRLSFDAKWTHLFKWQRVDQDGSTFEFAGTHGNCDVTNCAGTPADRLNLGANWERGAWRLGAVVNYRASIDAKLSKDDPDGCPNHYADGSEAPAGCRLASFTTVDLTGRWKANDRLEVFGSIQNLFDRIPPLDPVTYGAPGYNPFDHSGAVGRFYSVGLRYKF
jgi:iron complex outermembrane recepter protein